MCDRTAAPQPANGPHPTNAPHPTAALRAATALALWAGAGADPDSTLAALRSLGVDAGVRAATAQAAERSGLPAPGEPAAGTAALLPLLRAGGPARLVIPVPGDLRGLPTAPAGSALIGDALDAGAAAVFPEAGLALVPLHGQWRAHRYSGDHPALPEREARLLLDEAVRAATAGMLRADVAAGSRDRAVSLDRAVRDQELPLPPGMPAGAVSLLAAAMRLHGVLLLARRHGTAAASGHQLGAVDAALAPLQRAAHEARRTAVAMTALHRGETLTPRAAR